MKLDVGETLAGFLTWISADYPAAPFEWMCARRPICAPLALPSFCLKSDSLLSDGRLDWANRNGAGGVVRFGPAQGDPTTGDLCLVLAARPELSMLGNEAMWLIRCWSRRLRLDFIPDGKIKMIKEMFTLFTPWRVTQYYMCVYTAFQNNLLFR